MTEDLREYVKEQSDGELTVVKTHIRRLKPEIIEYTPYVEKTPYKVENSGLLLLFLLASPFLFFAVMVGGVMLFIKFLELFV